MGNTKRFVEIEVADIGSNIAQTAEADHGIHIGSVDIDLAPVGVDDLANAPHAGFKHAVGGGIGQHQCCQSVSVLSRFGFQVSDIHIAIAIARDDDHGHADHGRGGWICPVG